MSESEARLEAARFAGSARAGEIGGIARPDLVEGIRRFLVACYRDVGVAPHKLDGDTLRDLVLRHLARRCGRTDPWVPRMVALLRAYFADLEERKLVAQ